MGVIVQFTISEAELDELERGSPAPLLLNFALFFAGGGLNLVTTLLLIDPSVLPALNYAIAVALCAVQVLAAAVLGVLWWWFHRAPKCAHRIRSRLTDDVIPVQLAEIEEEP